LTWLVAFAEGRSRVVSCFRLGKKDGSNEFSSAETKVDIIDQFVIDNLVEGQG